MITTKPYPPELLRIARKVVWWYVPEQALENSNLFLSQLMVYGSSEDVKLVERYVSEEEFRNVLNDPPAGVFTIDAWKRWHERLGITPVPPLPRRRFPDGTLGPEAAGFGGR